LVPSADFDFVDELNGAMCLITDVHIDVVRARTPRLASNCQFYATNVCSDP
jgi:hypothetical protein